MPLSLAPFGSGTYTAVTARDGDQERTWDGVPSATLCLRSSDEAVTAVIYTGCNGLNLPVIIGASQLIPQAGMLTTAMACRGARAEQERWVCEFFAGPVGYTLAGPTLQLTAGTRTLILTGTRP